MVSSGLPEIFGVVVIQVGSQPYALPLASVRHVIAFRRPELVRPLPLAGRSIRGVTLDDGTPALVLDLPSLVDDSSTGSTRLDGFDDEDPIARASLGIVCAFEEEDIVLAGGHVRAIGRFRSADATASSSGGGSRQAVEWRGQVVPLLSLSQLIAKAVAAHETRREHDRR